MTKIKREEIFKQSKLSADIWWMQNKSTVLSLQRIELQKKWQEIKKSR